jgi:fimbrial isopeptide formation D2 family protein
MTIASARRRTRVAPLIGILAAGILGATAFAVPASAVEIGPNIDPAQTGSIILHKLVQPENPTALPNDGSELTPAQLAGLTPIAGVTFSLQSVDSIDLSTNAGWQTVDGLTAADVLADPAAYPLTAEGSGVTDGDGELTFGTLPLGVYLVTETSPGDNPIAQPTAPFLVTMPLPTGDNTWLYDVNVYPKNAVTEITKTVDDTAAFGLGDDVNWSITGSVPFLAAADPLTAFGITDVLDARLGFSSAEVSAVTAAGDPLALVATDYTVAAPTPVGTTGTVSVAFTPAGLAKLEANQGSIVTLALATEVLSIGDGSIENTATLAVNDSTTSADAMTNWGALEIFKYATVEGVETLLGGAQFQIFTSAADAGTLTDPVAVGGETVFTSNATTNILVEGLKAGDYWVVETVAPVGYVANTVPIPVTITVGSVADALLLEVENSQVPAWLLPLTGGGGAGMFAIGGGVLIAIAIGAAFVFRARRSRRVAA